MSDPRHENAEAVRARKRRNLALAIALLAFAALVFVVTIVRLGGNVLDRPL